ncbi:MAG TPA: hypothetical protein VLF95_02340 [Vicinamibacteria bacterium]|nr:hypothetical protein [Vicinamibacteria bacterium]
MAHGRWSLRLDPWGAEYEGSIQISDEDEVVPVDIRVESAAWAAVRPTAAARPERLVFVDGVRRVEHRLLIGDGERTVFGLLGSHGVGAVLVDGGARVGHERIGRVEVAGGGLDLDPFVAPVDGRGELHFEPCSEPENTPVAPVAGLQKAMRRAEASLAERLSAEGRVVFLDGPLTFLAAAGGSVVGFVKRLLRSYLDPSAHALLPRLEVGERTPLFLVAGREPRYSWYLRIARGRPIESALTGVVRLEARAARGLEEARALADLSAREMPRFASDATHDPRAPQNLFPIGGLEARLKHLLGDAAVVRRAIEARLHHEVTA